MNKSFSLLMLCTIILFSTSCKEKYTEYESVYNDSGYVLLKKKGYTKPNSFVNNFKDSSGNPLEVRLFIDTTTAIRMIGYYDEKFGSTDDQPKYIDFDPSEVFSMVTGLDDRKNKLRIYYSCYDTITARERYKNAWQSFVNKQTLVLVPTNEGTDMFKKDPINVGTPCPPVCPDYILKPTDTITGTRYLKIGQIKPRHRIKS